jgi:hypothetical protein
MIHDNSVGKFIYQKLQSYRRDLGLAGNREVVAKGGPARSIREGHDITRHSREEASGFQDERTKAREWMLLYTVIQLTLR